jgi:hypothetical protein
MNTERLMLKGDHQIDGRDLRNDDVFKHNYVTSLQGIIGMPTRQGYEKAVISNGKLVNVVSDSYGHLPNEKFFIEVERKLIDADIKYVTRSINREDRSFVVDYILSDDSYHISVKGKQDIIRPMLRFTNSYDGSCKKSGHFGFFRKICSNGLHVSEWNIGFSVKAKGDIEQVVLPEIGSLVNKFMDNEYYTLKKKFEVLAERPIADLSQFVKFVCDKTELFKYESSEKNPDPSLNARIVMDTVNNESRLLGDRPSLWLGYNAFNELLHGKLKKTFEAQKKLDGKLFETVLSLS